MGSEIQTGAASDCLIAAGRSFLMRGDTKFTIAQLCAEAGATDADFEQCFGTKAALFKALVSVPPGKEAAESRLRELEHSLVAMEQRFRKVEENLADRPAKGPRRNFLAPVLRLASRQAAPPNRQPRAATAAATMFILALMVGVPFLETARGNVAGRTYNRTPSNQTPGNQTPGSNDSGAPAASIVALTSRAENGNAKAQAALALAYLGGSDIKRDTDAAARWAQAAAAQGDADGQYLIGSLSLSGTGVARDPQQAFSWFLRSASAGNLKAMHNLAIAYVQGTGTPKNAAEGADWFARAASLGYVDSAFDLAVLYEQGLGVQQNAQEALRWYRVAANAGDKSAAARARFLETDGHP